MKSTMKISLIVAGIIALWVAGPPTSSVAQVNAPRVTNTSAQSPLSVHTPKAAAPGNVPSASSETLVIRSFPVGLNAYVVPKDVAEGMLGTVKMTAEEYFVGRTPVELDLEPGEYRVTVELDESFKFRRDGEVNILYVLTDAGEMAPIAKIYALDKRPDQQAYITALFWPEEMSLAEFVSSLPEEQLFPVVDEAGFLERFADYGIPSQDWPLLLAMLSQTGKVIWYSPDSSQYVFIYFTSPDTIVFQPLPPSSSTSVEVTPTTAGLAAELVYSSQTPVIAMASDRTGLLYAVTEDGDILQISPDGQSNVIYSGLTRCGFSLAAATVLPDGRLLVNTCVDNKDSLIAIDQAGNAATLLSLDDSLISMTSDLSGRVYLGVWHSEGNLTINYQPFTYLAGADQMNGRILAMAPDGALTPVYEGGLPMSLSVSQAGTLFASIWGQSGRFRPENKSYQVCDLRTAFWITLSDQVAIVQIADSQADVLTENFLGAADLTSANQSMFAVGRAGEDECGIYRFEPGKEPEKLLFAEEGVDQALTGLLVSSTGLHFANADGDVYRNDQYTLTVEEEPESTAPVAAPPSTGEAGTFPIMVGNADQLVLLNQFSVPWVRDLTWSPDGTRLTVVSEAGVWHFSRTSLEQELDSRPEREEPTSGTPSGDAVAATPMSVAYSPDGTLLALGDALDNTVRIVDATTGETRHEMTGHTGPVISVAFSPDGTLLASAAFGDYTARLWDATTGESLRVLDGHTDTVTSVAFSPDGTMLVTGSQDRTAILWDVRTGEMIRRFDASGDLQSIPAEQLVFSPDGSHLAWAGAGGVLFWDVKTGDHFGAVDYPFSAMGLAWAPQGDLLAVGTVEGQIKFLNTITGETVATLETHTSSINNLAFNPDGTVLAATGQDGAVMLWGAISAAPPSPACDTEVASFFADSYFGEDTLPEQLGCPIGAEQALYLVYQPFERGQFYEQPTGDILALLDDGHLVWGANTWQEGMPIDDPSLVPPPGLLQPTRGLGLFWRSSGALRDTMGWAITPETTIATIWQDFERGVMFLDADGHSHVLLTSEGRHFRPGSSPPDRER
jgi:WD40 repeat protein